MTRGTRLGGVASARFGEAACEIAEALEASDGPEVLLRLAGSVATATSAAASVGVGRPSPRSIVDPRNLLKRHDGDWRNLDFQSTSALSSASRPSW